MTSRELILDLIPKMNGWTSHERCVQMYDTAMAIKPSVIVEIGVFAGRSLISQALALRDLGNGKIYGIDPWRVEAALEGMKNQSDIDWWTNVSNIGKIHDECVETIWRLGLQDYVVLLQCRAHDCHSIIPHCQILYIDGNHEEISSCRDVQLYVPKLTHNGYLWFDDADWPQTQKALAMLDKMCVLHTDFGKYRLYVKP